MVALLRPAATEADVREADAAPGEDGREAREREHPVERVSLPFRSCKEGQETEHGGEANGDHRAAFAVDVGEDSGRLVLFCQRGESATAAVDGGVADGEDGDHDYGVEDGGEAFDAGVDDGDDEGGGCRVDFVGCV